MKVEWLYTGCCEFCRHVRCWWIFSWRNDAVSPAWPQLNVCIGRWSNPRGQRYTIKRQSPVRQRRSVTDATDSVRPARHTPPRRPQLNAVTILYTAGIEIHFRRHARQHQWKLDSLRRFSQRRSPTPHSWGVRTQRALTPNSNSTEIFVQCTYPQVSSSYLLVHKLSCWQTNPQTNKQTDAAENIQRSLRYATTLGSNHSTTQSPTDNQRLRCCVAFWFNAQ